MLSMRILKTLNTSDVNFCNSACRRLRRKPERRAALSIAFRSPRDEYGPLRIQAGEIDLPSVTNDKAAVVAAFQARDGAKGNKMAVMH